MSKVIKFYSDELGSGGVAKVMTIWANYLSEIGHKIYLITLHKKLPFFYVNRNVNLMNIIREEKFKFISIFKNLLLEDLSSKDVTEYNIFNKKFYIKYVFLVKILRLNKSRPVQIYFVHGGSNNLLLRYSVFDLIMLKFAFSVIVVLYQNIGLKENDKIFKFRVIKKMIVNKLKIVEIPNPVIVKPTERGKIKKNVVLSVGRLDPIKGFDLLINAWHLVKLNSTSWKLIIVGDGPERDNLDFLINRLGLNSEVSVLPATSNIEKYYSECRLFISSSTHEGFGLAMVEALYFNLPVISFPTEGARKIIINNYNGIILKDFNVENLALEIQNTLNNEDILKKLAENTQDSVQHLSVEKISRNWEKIWQIKSL